MSKYSVHESRFTREVRLELECQLDDMRSGEISGVFAAGEALGLSRALRVLQALDNDAAIQDLRDRWSADREKRAFEFDTQRAPSKSASHADLANGIHNS